MSYTTEAKVENMFGVDITGGKSTALIDIIAAVKTFIDRYCGKTFEAVSEARYYDWCGERRIVVDSFVGNPTALEFLNPDGSVARTLTIGADEDYIIAPYNSDSSGLAEKYEIILTNKGWSGNTGWFYAGLPTGIKAIKLTASFGASTSVPADIQLVATKLAGLLSQENADGILKSITLGDYSATYDSIEGAARAMGVIEILDSYRDITI